MNFFTLSSIVFLTIFSSFSHATAKPKNMQDLSSFGENPGQLSANYLAATSANKPLVVLLHGCIQNGVSLAQQSGLYSQAKKQNFTLLIPQQNKNNNAKLCFNWFSSQDIEHNKGELLSLKNMILTTSELTKASKVYIVGLSAGGAMTSNLMVQYPELFEAGAIIAGIPYPCADNLIKAISCMRSGPSSSSSELASQVIKHKSNKPHWPRLSIWVGENDKVVHPNNAKILAQQWAKLSSLSEFKKHTLKNEVTRQVWRNSQDEKQVELVSIGAIGHGYPINPTLNSDEQAADFVIPTSISATTEILKFWHLDN